MESDAERGFGSAENDGEELSPVLTTMSLNRGMDSIVAKAGTLSTLENMDQGHHLVRAQVQARDRHDAFRLLPVHAPRRLRGHGRLERDGHAVRREGLASRSGTEGIDENVVECASGSVGRATRTRYFHVRIDQGDELFRRSDMQTELLMSTKIAVFS